MRILIAATSMALLSACGAGPRIVKEVERVPVEVPVEVPGDTVYVQVPVEVLVPVLPPEEPPVKCAVFADLSSPLLSQANNTSKFLPLVHSTRGDAEIGLESLTLTEEADDNIAFAEFEGTEVEDVTKNFALRCEFLFEAMNAGTHTFALTSDDGSQLYVNGVKVVDNGGAHGMVVKSGNVTLPVGVHQMRLLYYQGNGAKGLNLTVQRPALVQPVEDL